MGVGREVSKSFWDAVDGDGMGCKLNPLKTSLPTCYPVEVVRSRSKGMSVIAEICLKNLIPDLVYFKCYVFNIMDKWCDKSIFGEYKYSDWPHSFKAFSGVYSSAIVAHYCSECSVVCAFTSAVLGSGLALSAGVSELFGSSSVVEPALNVADAEAELSEWRDLDAGVSSSSSSSNSDLPRLVPLLSCCCCWSSLKWCSWLWKCSSGPRQRHSTPRSRSKWGQLTGSAATSASNSRWRLKGPTVRHVGHL